ncbi:MAG: glutamate synthase subunit alpha, partial [Chloroflexaceae bacterium]|nr:glutamate synthase subunit alpha [Chloroflexaceae bacterium]
ELVERFFRHLAEELRGWLASLGLRRLAEAIGRADLLEPLATESPRTRGLRLERLLAPLPVAGPIHASPRPAASGALERRLTEELLPAIAANRGFRGRYPIANTDRAVGARLSGAIARRYGDQGEGMRPIELEFEGSAGQSFGAFNAGGLHLALVGEANDYVGKGMAGGRIVVRPPPAAGWLAR